VRWGFDAEQGVGVGSFGERESASFSAVLELRARRAHQTASRENLRIRGKKGDLSPWTSLGASA
jgi:hypothetical protein